MTLDRIAELRYAGQAHELQVTVPAGPVSVDRLIADFVAEHVRTYGHGSRADPVELVSVRVLARVPSASATTYDALPRIAAQERELGSREAYFGPEHGTVETPVLSRAALMTARGRGRSSSTSTTPRSSSRRAAPRASIGSATSG